MLATEPLRRLHRAIVELNLSDLEAIAERARRPPQYSTNEQMAARHAVDILGTVKAHDVMFLAHYVGGPPAGPAWNALSHTALAVAALPDGLTRSDYEALVAPVIQVIPWLVQLPDREPEG
ncbi:MAG TPA: hypothetical protein VND96_18110 [Candidatus Micrarchaeaceae archaeon]|nr:hypothetical protein [Candidatus Micrarchaeaceae archaeon]